MALACSRYSAAVGVGRLMKIFLGWPSSAFVLGKFITACGRCFIKYLFLFRLGASVRLVRGSDRHYYTHRSRNTIQQGFERKIVDGCVFSAGLMWCGECFLRVVRVEANRVTSSEISSSHSTSTFTFSHDLTLQSSST